MSTTTTTKTKTSKDNRQGRRFRTGCKTCKSRRIQCDETRPACNACVKQGRTCPGYQREFKWSTKHELSSARARRRTAESEEGDSMTGVAGESPESTGSTVEVENKQLEEAFDAVSGLLASEGGGHGHDIGGNSGGIPTVGSLDGLAELYGRIYGDSFGWLMGLDEDDQTQAQAQVVAQVQEELPESIQADLPVGGLEEDEVDEPAEFEALLQSDVLALEDDVPQPILSTPTMTETTPFLIEYWFKNVCSMWSSFDSDRNLIRKLASHTWSHNAAVFHSLQTMSALHLSEQLPHLHATATTSWTAAMQSIQQELSTFTQHRSSPPQFPTGLLLALAGIGTTTCWTDSQQLGIPLLQKMKTILAYYNQPGMLSASTTDRTYLEFFNDSCAYWDILCRVVTDEQDATGPATTTLIGPIPGSSPPSTTTTNTFTSPHPWVGVSRPILDLFAHTILLCRRHSKRLRSPNHATLHSLQELIRDIHAARALRQTLTSTTLQSSNLTETGDARTPLSHLVDVAEGYRLAALLHLYQTFPDLRDDHTRELGAADISNWSLQALALELLDLVKRIPLESGSRVIQPLLYLSIATGLKAPDAQSAVGAPLLNQMALQVSQARRVVMQRVSVLEYSLPSKPIRVLKALIQRIWEVGDREGEVGVGGGMAKHWSEVMEEGRLRTMFG
ncbi:hypothetical protein ASPACDRAFT_123454 [Aspergillus aculeatus ATCC 16872]|uniref:Zn(2)-C6 fungal-type domain-containing protein n=1 Tax=Aspergillus aculeatus (strain ATCC 16872 / CBS 172.66 / WB 5094) TaxID=690307 RepID=A0A1L9WMX0_ASPA1|nr:uncharacterized protein ASPACDRAFT_123454 [Aspergillus aculeatus ATCC 16872]OJJ97525.1 hypothetical protein ASPACDRAFT_123454 [Aspergillus aculeatus ATCC 16872]